MQPYFFPYIGYFQLINSVDQFVIFDDVNFIKRGWINRNRILLNNEEYLFTLPLSKASQNSLIRDIEIFDHQKSKASLLEKIYSSYKKAPFFNETINLIEEIVSNPEQNLSKYIGNSLVKICAYFEIKTNFIYASDLSYNRLCGGQEKIMTIIKKLRANSYYNLPNGVDLYDAVFFANNDVKLKFIKPVEIHYQQFNKNNFIPNLSVVDLLMFNSRDHIKFALEECL